MSNLPNEKAHFPQPWVRTPLIIYVFCKVELMLSMENNASGHSVCFAFQYIDNEAI